LKDHGKDAWATGTGLGLGLVCRDFGTGAGKVHLIEEWLYYVRIVVVLSPRPCHGLVDSCWVSVLNGAGQFPFYGSQVYLDEFGLSRTRVHE
jgi:hypothetical protein